MSKLVQVQNLKTYFGTPNNPFKAVDDISFDIQPGKTFCLVGESGSGKSITSLSMIQLVPQPAGFHPSGKILFNYKHNNTEKVIDLIQLSEASKRQVRGAKIAMIFQEPMTSLNPVLSIGYQICEPLKRHMKLSSKQAMQKALDLLIQVQIPSPQQRLKEYPHQLSGGMRQRVMIAMALSCEPDLLIADEPTTALDVTVQAQILKLMKDLQKRKGTAILFITHDFGVVNQMADQVAVMKLGKIVEQGSKEQILRNPQHPYTKELIASLPANLDKPSFAKNKETADQASTESDPTLIDIQDMQVYFPIKKGLFKKTVGHVKAVDHVDLKIRKGQILALVGESGSGKTTLGKALLRLIPPTGGKVIFQGQDLITLNHRQMRKHRHDLQIIFQDPFSSLNPRMMIGDAIMEGMIAQGIGNNYKERLLGVKESLRLAQLDPDLVTRYPHEFSGGQRQRIGIARCLAVQPKFIVCDEITSALDVSVQASILKLLLKLRDQLDLTLLFITHNMEVVEYLADEVAVMYQGKIVEKGSAHQICRSPKHPYTQQLLAAVPRINAPVSS